MYTLPLFVNQWQTWLIILVVVLVLFGATRLPALSKSLGQSVKIFRSEIKTDGDAKTEGTASSDASEPAKPVDGTPSDKS
ncbi:twin-arginine translocase TatA/TatE family subunit [Protaetiibacter sp. SSC-01]|uniref:twin-arginine translocase TatA/TatE family subunit n=1 Tax=Protaetiibacter sp. SSC-01 TaxID=2759943 RepID=UPI00165748B0|nr:twin-arginine translocase TatA/TatE family subunit [Protaetiibacter sp. SSC-01]QNO38710.1 twin-arginine translocase TatA/TatE family subunit [Protaetiibacter sp. SSC-01]